MLVAASNAQQAMDIRIQPEVEGEGKRKGAHVQKCLPRAAGASAGTDFSGMRNDANGKPGCNLAGFSRYFCLQTTCHRVMQQALPISQAPISSQVHHVTIQRGNGHAHKGMERWGWGLREERVWGHPFLCAPQRQASHSGCHDFAKETCSRTIYKMDYMRAGLHVNRNNHLCQDGNLGQCRRPLLAASHPQPALSIKLEAGGEGCLQGTHILLPRKVPVF